ncbi:MAG: 50S ribosomal protein L21, partial [Gammaproteobacteria bacterium GWE2_37_16]
YAIIASGGKQHKVTLNEIVKLEKLGVATGENVEFNNVLMLADGDNLQIGAPYLANVKVTGEVIEEGRHDKIHILKFRRRKHFMKRAGHRQHYTAVKITNIG